MARTADRDRPRRSVVCAFCADHAERVDYKDVSGRRDSEVAPHTTRDVADDAQLQEVDA